MNKVWRDYFKVVSTAKAPLCDTPFDQASAFTLPIRVKLFIQRATGFALYYGYVDTFGGRMYGGAPRSWM